MQTDNTDSEIDLNISAVKNLKILNRETVENLGCRFDRTKVVFSIEGYTGKELENILRDDYNIELEMSDQKYGLGMSTLFDSEEDLKSLYTALTEIAKTEQKKESDRTIKNIPKDSLYKKLNLRDAFYSDKETVKLDDAAGRLAGEMLTPYPPGIPLFVPGEEIDSESVEYIKYLIDLGITVQGVEDGKIKVIR